MPREKYDYELRELRLQIINMIMLVQKIFQESISALKRQDAEEAEKISENDDVVDNLFEEIQSMCWKIILKEQPVAGDLKFVKAILKMVTDLERIGDQAADIASLTVQMSGKPYTSEIKLIEKMAQETTTMLMEAAEAFKELNNEKAKSVVLRDDFVDEVFSSVKLSVAQTVSTETQGAMQEVNLLLVAKYFERIGDHTVNIAESVLSMI